MSHEPAGAFPGDRDDPDDLTEALTPAQRYARSRERSSHPDLTRFAEGRPFRLDPFQLQACQALEDGHGVLVCAPTGAGKTVVGEFAVARALAHGGKCFYTTPIKALSNQKYADLAAEHGPAKVGLLTGDTSVNSHAPVVVMTTEVLRNMIYAASPDLTGLTAVVLDEVHYLADRFRGPVWEEVILQLPAQVQIVGLSATVSNAEEFGSWLQAVRGDTAVVVDEVRPVPLWQHMMVGRRLYDLFSIRTSEVASVAAADIQARIDPGLTRAVQQAADTADRFGVGHVQGRRGRPATNQPRWRPPARVDVIEKLDGSGLLPAITFVFSRAGCEAAVTQCVRSGMRLTTEAERHEIDRIIDRHTAELPEADLSVLGYWEWREALGRGIAAHHAGLLPAFKETVEELFVEGLVKAVFATETLALGINMPARTVVLEKLVKFNGEGHQDLTPGEYTQLTGRAGRRGIDVEGHAVVVWQPGVDPRTVAGLASKRTFPLRSSFRPSYNMAVNLVGRLGRPAAKELLEQSFAQFQADASVVGLVRQVRRNATAIAQYTASMECHLGDVGEYVRLAGELSNLEKQQARSGAARRRQAVGDDLLALHRGDVVQVPSGRRAGLAVVLEPGIDADGIARPLVVTVGAWAGRLGSGDFRGRVPVLGRLRLDKMVDHRSPKVRRDISASITAAVQAGRITERPPAGPRLVSEDEELVALRRAVRHHPVHGCADRDAHLQWARRWWRLTTENAALEQKVSGAKNSLGAELDRILVLLGDRGFVSRDRSGEDRLTPAGNMLARIWAETDLVVAECLRAGSWQQLSGADLAATVSCLVYEARRDTGAASRLPAGPAGNAIAATVRVWSSIAGQERDLALPVTREPDAGFAGAVGVWARGGSLSEALVAASVGGAELSAGDFVRWCRQVIDLLDQIRLVAGPVEAAAARTALSALRRGVVALGAA